MPPRPFILVVNGRKVRQPVFVIGAPHSGVDLLARALKQTAGFHLTIGQPSVLSVAYAFARTPSLYQGRDAAVVTVLRDAFAQAWQVAPHSCLACQPDCRQAGARVAGTACVDERTIFRYGDASPALLFCADLVAEAFPDAKVVQIVRDCRDVVAEMLANPEELSWLRPGVENVDGEFPNPFFGVETATDRMIWPRLSAAGKCAMRWRGSVRKMARLRGGMDADRLTTFRYEQVIREPEAATKMLSEFVDADTADIDVTAERERARDMREALTMGQLAEIEHVAGGDLRRIGYGS